MVVTVDVRRGEFMPVSLENIFSIATFIYLTGLVAGSLILANVGIKGLKINNYNGVAYVALSVFLILAHTFFLFNANAEGSTLNIASQFDVLTWSSIFLGPALIFIYLLSGVYNIFQCDFTAGAVKVLIGFGLAAALYSLGQHWPDSVKAVLSVLSCALWFHIELRAVDEIR
jgi:hypothetical protein